jgi:hypothetical protein
MPRSTSTAKLEKLQLISHLSFFTFLFLFQPHQLHDCVRRVWLNYDGSLQPLGIRKDIL